jgi:hypothetical protein
MPSALLCVAQENVRRFDIQDRVVLLRNVTFFDGARNFSSH